MASSPFTFNLSNARGPFGEIWLVLKEIPRRSRSMVSLRPWSAPGPVAPATLSGPYGGLVALLQ